MKLINKILSFFKGSPAKPTKAPAKITRLNTDPIEAILAEYLEQERFLEPGFSLHQLSSDINIPYFVISKYFSLQGTNFNDWKNRLRIKHVIFLMEQGDLQLYTLDTLARQAGFLSRSNFNESFKKVTGMTAKNYSKKIKP